MTDPITVDIGAAMSLLEANPEIAAKMNELAFGKVAADQLAAREELIVEMGRALQSLDYAIQDAGNEFEAGNNSDAWEYVMCGRLAAKSALAKYLDFVGEDSKADLIETGDWTPWEGGPNPFAEPTKLDVIRFGKMTWVGFDSTCHRWENDHSKENRVIAYRIRTDAPSEKDDTPKGLAA